MSDVFCSVPFLRKIINFEYGQNTIVVSSLKEPLIPSLSSSLLLLNNIAQSPQFIILILPYLKCINVNDEEEIKERMLKKQKRKTKIENCDYPKVKNSSFQYVTSNFCSFLLFVVQKCVFFFSIRFLFLFFKTVKKRACLTRAIIAK